VSLVEFRTRPLF